MCRRDWQKERGAIVSDDVARIPITLVSIGIRNCKSPSLTYTVNGERHVERMPAKWAQQVRRRVRAGREFQDAVREVLAANAKLLVLARKQEKQQKKKK